MEAVFACDGTEMQGILDKIQRIQEVMNSSYTNGGRILTDIQSKTHWTGNTQITMQAFMDILLQYHKELAADGPVAEAGEALSELMAHLGGFYDNWEEWEELEGIL